MAGFPAWMQPGITLLTGKSLPGEKPSLSLSPAANLMLSIAAMISLMTINIYLFAHSVTSGLVMLPITWIFCTGLLRKIQVVFAHHCVHRTFFVGNPVANDIMLELLTTLTLVQNGVEYRRDHLGHHNRELFTTKDDADAALLYKLGFLPGLKKSALWKRLFLVLFSPQLHWIFLKSRFQSNFVNRSLPGRIVAISWAVAITIGLSLLVPWWQLALVIWLPLFVLYNASALIQFITEHAWMLSAKAPAGIEAYADRCWGRFFGDPCPINVRGVKAIYQWAHWLVKMVFVHVPVRFACFVGDLPAHDWHHLCTIKNLEPASWPRALYSRQNMIDSGVGLGMEQRELWGLKSMLDHVFSLLESVDEEIYIEKTKAA